MLVLSRKKNEEILLSGGVKIQVVDIRGDKVRLGFDAPAEVRIHRKGVHDERIREVPPDQMCEVAGQLAILAKKVAAKQIDPDDLASCLHHLGVTVERMGKVVA